MLQVKYPNQIHLIRGNHEAGCGRFEGVGPGTNSKADFRPSQRLNIWKMNENEWGGNAKWWKIIRWGEKNVGWTFDFMNVGWTLKFGALKINLTIFCTSQDPTINAIYGFRDECRRRLNEARVKLRFKLGTSLYHMQHTKCIIFGLKISFIINISIYNHKWIAIISIQNQSEASLATSPKLQLQWNAYIARSLKIRNLAGTNLTGPLGYILRFSIVLHVFLKPMMQNCGLLLVFHVILCLSYSGITQNFTWPLQWCFDAHRLTHTCRTRLSRPLNISQWEQWLRTRSCVSMVVRTKGTVLVMVWISFMLRRCKQVLYIRISDNRFLANY